MLNKEISTMSLNSENSTKWETLHAARAHAFHNIKRTRFFTSSHWVFQIAITPLSKQIIVFFLSNHVTTRLNCICFPSYNDHRYPRVCMTVSLLARTNRHANRFKRETLYDCNIVAISIYNTNINNYVYTWTLPTHITLGQIQVLWGNANESFQSPSMAISELSSIQ